MWRRLTRVGSPSGGEYERPLPLAMSLEPAQPSDAAPTVAVESELERLRRYLEVSQAALKATEQEMQVVRGQQVVADSRWPVSSPSIILV
jgi:hypothetical protein